MRSWLNQDSVYGFQWSKNPKINTNFLYRCTHSFCLGEYIHFTWFSKGTRFRKGLRTTVKALDSFFRPKVLWQGQGHTQTGRPILTWTSSQEWWSDSPAGVWLHLSWLCCYYLLQILIPIEHGWKLLISLNCTITIKCPMLTSVQKYCEGQGDEHEVIFY